MGANKTICKTTDGGISWSMPKVPLPNLPSTVAFYDVQFLDVSPNLGWAVGSAGTILRTENGGNQWKVQPSGTTNTLRAIHMVNINRGWVVGDALTIRRTLNIGNTWSAQNLGNFDSVRDVYCGNITQCKVVGGSSGGSTPIKWTNNAGTNWFAATVSNPTTLLGVHFASTLRGFAVGYGAIRSTTDGGLYWSKENSGTTAALRAVYCVNQFNCWAVGDGGIILKGPAGVWGKQNSGTTASLHHVHFIDANTGWAVGAAVGTKRTLLKTTNGGKDWFPLLKDEE